MNIVYLILAHNNPHLLQSMIRALADDNVFFYVHIDNKSECNFDFLEHMSNVYCFPERFDVSWGDIGLVKTLLYCCEEICKKHNCNTYIALLGGLDYPVKSNAYIKEYLTNNKFNFITGYRIPSNDCCWQEKGRRRIECYSIRLGSRSIATIAPREFNTNNLKQIIKVFCYKPQKIAESLKILLFFPKRHHPDNIVAYGGEFWWVLPVETLNKILQFVNENSNFIEYHTKTSIPDEIFFSTLVYNLIDNKLIKQTCLRFINWNGKPSPNNITLENRDLIDSSFKDKDILFARKVISTEAREYINKLIKNQN